MGLVGSIVKGIVGGGLEEREKSLNEGGKLMADKYRTDGSYGWKNKHQALLMMTKLGIKGNKHKEDLFNKTKEHLKSNGKKRVYLKEVMPRRFTAPKTDRDTGRVLTEEERNMIRLEKTRKSLEKSAFIANRERDYLHKKQITDAQREIKLATTPDEIAMARQKLETLQENLYGANSGKSVVEALAKEAMQKANSLALKQQMIDSADTNERGRIRQMQQQQGLTAHQTQALENALQQNAVYNEQGRQAQTGQLQGTMNQVGQANEAGRQQQTGQLQGTMQQVGQANEAGRQQQTGQLQGTMQQVGQANEAGIQALINAQQAQADIARPAVAEAYDEAEALRPDVMAGAQALAEAQARLRLRQAQAQAQPEVADDDGDGRDDESGQLMKPRAETIYDQYFSNIISPTQKALAFERLRKGYILLEKRGDEIIAKINGVVVTIGHNADILLPIWNGGIGVKALGNISKEHAILARDVYRRAHFKPSQVAEKFYDTIIDRPDQVVHLQPDAPELPKMTLRQRKGKQPAQSGQGLEKVKTKKLTKDEKELLNTAIQAFELETPDGMKVGKRLLMKALESGVDEDLVFGILNEFK